MVEDLSFWAGMVVESKRLGRVERLFLGQIVREDKGDLISGGVQTQLPFMLAWWVVVV